MIILGSGPNRIGQGIEFDYCCVHAVQEMRELGYQAIMVNCNPETVSTDYDTSDRLYFEPLAFEDVMNIIDNEKPKGVVVQFGGQTPLKIAERLHAAGVTILGTSQEAIDLAEDRERFGAVLEQLKLKAPPYGTVRNETEAIAVAERIGYPVLVRPSYVLGGRAMEIVYDQETLQHYLHTAVKASPNHPVLIDRFLEHSTEIDVDAICDGEDVYIGAVMQHVEEAGVHSGDSACVIPTITLGEEVVRRIEEQTAALAQALGVVGLMNVQYAVQQSDHGGASVYVLEVNPRGSRTVPFVSKATGVPLARIATQGDRRTEAARHGSSRLGGIGGRRPPAAAARPALRGRQGGGAALPAFPRSRHHPGTGDEIHRRGDGRGAQLRRGLCQGHFGGRRPAPIRGHGLHLRRRCREGRGHPHGPHAEHSRLPHPRHRRDLSSPDAERGRLRAGAQAHRRSGTAGRRRGASPAAMPLSRWSTSSRRGRWTWSSTSLGVGGRGPTATRSGARRCAGASPP